MAEQPTSAEIAVILDKAANVIERNGWTKGLFFDASAAIPAKDCPVCALGAINIAAGGEPEANLDERPVAAYRAFAEYLGLRIDSGSALEFSNSIGDHWNDAPDRTAEQVIHELRACAASLRTGGAS